MRDFRVTSFEESIWTQTFAYSIAMGRSLDTAAFNAARSVLLFRGDHNPISLEDCRTLLQILRDKNRPPEVEPFGAIESDYQATPIHLRTRSG